MRKIFNLKWNIFACLLSCIISGGIGVCSYAAETINMENSEESSIAEDGTSVQEKMQVQVSQNVSCTVDQGGTVTYAAVLNHDLLPSDDGLLYLLEMAPYEYDVTNNTNVSNIYIDIYL